MLLSQVQPGTQFVWDERTFKKIKMILLDGKKFKKEKIFVLAEDGAPIVYEWQDREVGIVVELPVYFDDLSINEHFVIKGYHTEYVKILLNPHFHTAEYGQLEVSTGKVFPATQSEVLRQEVC